MRELERLQQEEARRAGQRTESLLRQAEEDGQRLAEVALARDAARAAAEAEARAMREVEDEERRRLRAVGELKRAERERKAAEVRAQYLESLRAEEVALEWYIK